jgi:hypothetical protein
LGKEKRSEPEEGNKVNNIVDLLLLPGSSGKILYNVFSAVFSGADLRRASPETSPSTSLRAMSGVEWPGINPETSPGQAPRQARDKRA